MAVAFQELSVACEEFFTPLGFIFDIYRIDKDGQAANAYGTEGVSTCIDIVHPADPRKYLEEFGREAPIMTRNEITILDIETIEVFKPKAQEAVKGILNSYFADRLARIRFESGAVA